MPEVNDGGARHTISVCVRNFTEARLKEVTPPLVLVVHTHC